MTVRRIIQLMPNQCGWDNIQSVSEETFMEYVAKGGNWAEVVYGDQEYRIHLDWDNKNCTENVLPDYKALGQMVFERFPEAKDIKNIGCAMKATRPNPKQEGKYIQSVRFFIRTLKANLADMKNILMERGFKEEEGWDLGIYKSSRRALNCVGMHKQDDPTKTPLLIMPQINEWNTKPSANWLTAQILYGEETLIKSKMPKVEKEIVKKVIPDEFEGDRISKVIALLKCISPNCDYNGWLEILMAVKSVLEDIDEAYEIADKWSERGESYDSRVFGRTWSSIRDLTKYTMGTLIYRAKNENPDLFRSEFVEKFKPRNDWDNIKKMKNYADIKKVFETRVCKIKDSVRFIYKHDRDVRIYTRKTLKEAFENINYVHTNEKGKEEKKCFIDQWFKDGTMLEYEHALNIPPPLVVPKDTYNLWVDFEWKKPKYEDMEIGDTQLINDHMKVLCDFKEDVYEHFRKMIAYKLQFPARKTNVMIVISSAEGTGKSKFFDVLARVFGEEKCIELSAPEKELFGTFAYKWADKQLVLLNDFNPAELKRENAERMKGLITETNITLERKGIDQFETKQYCQFMAFSQSVAPVPINSGSRRYFMFSASSAKKGDTEYFKNLVEWTQEDRNIKAFYDELMQMDLTDFVPEKFPNTEIMEIAKMANISSTEMFMQDRKEKIIKKIEYRKTNESGYWIKCNEADEGAKPTLNHNELFTEYQTWVNLQMGNNPSFNIHKRKFQAELYKQREQYGLEYRGDKVHPQFTCWIIKDMEKWEPAPVVKKEDEYDPLDD